MLQDVGPIGHALILCCSCEKYKKEDLNGDSNTRLLSLKLAERNGALPVRQHDVF